MFWKGREAVEPMIDIDLGCSRGVDVMRYPGAALDFISSFQSKQ